MKRVTVVDYGAGNLLNVVRALEHCGANPIVVDTAAPIAEASSLILPGVGAFGDCMKALHMRGLVDALLEHVAQDKLFLGICVGMQVMFDVGEEFGEHKGLGIIGGRVVRINDKGVDGKAHKIPHIGWSRLHKSVGAVWAQTPLAPLEGAAETDTYFIHSYMGMPADSTQRLADVEYDGLSICAAVKKGNSYGCQFHPEKSGKAGLSILKQFLQMAA